jgi:hypothetical protein
MDLEHIITQTKIYTKDDSQMGSNTGLEYIIIQMETNMRATWKKGSGTAQESYNLVMGIAMKVICPYMYNYLY